MAYLSLAIVDFQVKNISTLISFIALIASFSSIYYSYKFHTDKATKSLLEKEFDSFNELTELRIDNWELGYLFELKENYKRLIPDLYDTYSDSSEASKLEIKLKERAVAMRIFEVYEHTIFQYDHAEKQKDSQRKDFLEDILSYFTDKLLRNPRLLYLWHEEYGNLQIHFTDRAQNHFEENIFNELESVEDELDRQFLDSIPV